MLAAHRLRQVVELRAPLGTARLRDGQSALSPSPRRRSRPASALRPAAASRRRRRRRAASAGRPSGIAFHAFVVMTPAPTIGAQAESRACTASAGTTGTAARPAAVVGRPSIMPVVRPVVMSVIAIARGSKPLALNHCTMRSLPADVQSLTCLQVGDGRHRLLREHLRPAAVAPVEEDEAFRLDALAQASASASSVT